MGLNGKDNNFRLDTFHHQLRNTCTEFGIHRSVIDRFIGQVEKIKRSDLWELQKEEDKDA